MAKPTKPKDMKPKADGDVATLSVAGAAPPAGGSGGGLDLKFLITLVVVVLSTTLTSAASVYFLAPMVVMPPLQAELKNIAKAAGGEGHAEGNSEAHAETPGLNLELDEFTVNLREDPSMPGSQYLRAKMSLNISVPEAENCYAIKHAQAMPDQTLPGGGKIVGAAANLDRTTIASGGGAEDPTVACIGKFKTNMAKFVPTMRDIINGSLMKRSAGTLSTLEGQEALKDEIKESINQFMGEHYQISRVNFEDFIIQK
ncbi:MAG: flagellar basal body-associated FliL family protein [Vampirovibrionales bacterium]|nr:flagellar basal body-associated FliL family protein [Vampirovibrionales bacterium]